MNNLNLCILPLVFLLLSARTQAQIVPDATLPVNSTVNRQGNAESIEGGTRTGGNLFHSFQEFSLPTGNTAFFNNASDIQNIFTRVTGGAISNIDGIIKANGTANLFLLNPNGIVFGPNARLNIGGSFLGSTASSVNFADGTQFSATLPQIAPLLTVSVPIGLQFGQNPGAIVVRGTGHNLTVQNPLLAPISRGEVSSSLQGLRVEPGKTLALIGGNIALESGILTAQTGQIEIGSVGEGKVNFNTIEGGTGWIFNYREIPFFKDILLSQRALVDASGVNAGSIGLRGRNLEIRDGSTVLVQNQGMRSAGSIDVFASESIELRGTTPNGSIRSSLNNETVGSGKGGDISVSTGRLVLEGGGSISTRSFGIAPGGNITVSADNYVDFSGFSPLNPLIASGISAFTLGSGNAGNIAISSGRVSVRNGGNILSGTFATGAGGSVIINARESVEAIGITSSVFLASVIGSATLNAGSAGNVTIETPRLIVRDGASVSASTLASGNSGNVIINARDSVEVNAANLSAEASVIDRTLRELFRLPEMPSGASGDVTINTSQLIVSGENGVISVITAKNNGTGNGGTLRVTADSIVLQNRGFITAATASGNGGNAIVQTSLLQLRNRSGINATAGGSGNGGNLTIDADTISALGDSFITANAEKGRGGIIQINASGLFRSLDSPISAASQFGVSGIVEVRTPDTNVENTFVPLSNNFVALDVTLKNNCPIGSRAGNSFTVTGTGGLASTPYEMLGSSYNFVEFRPLEELPIDSESERDRSSESSNPKIGDNYPTSIVEAREIIVTADGRTMLVSTPQWGAIENVDNLVCH